MLSTACAQNTDTARRAKTGVTAEPEDESKKTSGKKDKKTEKKETSAAKKFCGAGSAPKALMLDAKDKVLRVDGSAASICDLLENHGVLMFQLVEPACDGCADKIFRTKNFLALSRIQSSIRHLALFSGGGGPTDAEIGELALTTDAVANDSKALLAESFTTEPAQDGTSFLLISSKGTLETFSSERYLDAIKKAEDLVRAVASSTEETTPDALKASSVLWDGTSTRGNKRYALIATE